MTLLTETVPLTSAEPVRETTVVAPPPGAIQTGRPVTPLSPEPVVVGTIPEMEIAAACDTRTVPETLTVPLTRAEPVKETTVVAPPPGAIHTGSPVTPERPEPVVVGVIPEI
jgi:hypothetical protein